MLIPSLIMQGYVLGTHPPPAVGQTIHHKAPRLGVCKIYNTMTEMLRNLDIYFTIRPLLAAVHQAAYLSKGAIMTSGKGLGRTECKLRDKEE